MNTMQITSILLSLSKLPLFYIHKYKISDEEYSNYWTTTDCSIFLGAK